jgi:TonB family protein
MLARRGVGGLLAVGFLCASVAVAWSDIDIRSRLSSIGLPDSSALIGRTKAVEAQANTTGIRDSAVRLAQTSGQQQSSESARGYYLGQIDDKIATNWFPNVPKGATDKDKKVVIRFRVMRSGEVRDIRVETSSGDADLDILAFAAIRKSAPFPPFPNLLTEPHLDLTYSFVVERG